MQPRCSASLLFAILFATARRGGAALLSSASSTAETRAASWLRAHRGAPQPDELAELKSANPEAYAIVKALLTKRSLGLLDPKHPTASFAAAPPKDSNAPSGAAVFEKMAAESGDAPKVAALYPDAPVAAHHDWLSWKPQGSAVEDESMVKSVLGAAAELKAGSVAGGRGQEAASKAAAEDMQWTEAFADPPSSVKPAASRPATAAAAAAAVALSASPVLPTPDAKPVASMSQENSYLKGIDFGLGQPPSAPVPVTENSYLKGIDLLGNGEADTAAASTAAGAAAHPAVGLSAIRQTHDSHDYLASFSWDDDAQAGAHKATRAASQSVGSSSGAGTAVQAPPKNALVAWLSGRKPQPQKAAAQKQKAPEAVLQQNSYLSALQ